jgi:hypothetical protein
VERLHNAKQRYHITQTNHMVCVLPQLRSLVSYLSYHIHLQLIAPYACAANCLQGAHKQLQAVQAAAPDEAPAAAGAAAAAAAAAAIQRQVTPDFSRKQLKSLRRLFPMQAPAVKSAVTLQVRYAARAWDATHS